MPLPLSLRSSRRLLSDSSVSSLSSSIVRPFLVPVCRGGAVVVPGQVHVQPGARATAGVVVLLVSGVGAVVLSGGVVPDAVPVSILALPPAAVLRRGVGAVVVGVPGGGVGAA